jgi:hypothetical protein
VGWYRKLEMADFLELRISTIPKAGKGLFVTRDIKKGSIIGEYTGKRFSPSKILSGHAEVYSFSTYSGVIISPDDTCLFKYANDIVNLECSMLYKKLIYYSHLKYNITWHLDPEETARAKTLKASMGDSCFRDADFMAIERVWIMAIQDIKEGSELFIDYGDGYWLARVKQPKYRLAAPPVSGEELGKFLDTVNKKHWSRKQYYALLSSVSHVCRHDKPALIHI